MPLVRQVALPGRYPAHCPVEFDFPPADALSRPRDKSSACRCGTKREGGRSSGRLGDRGIIAHDDLDGQTSLLSSNANMANYLVTGGAGFIGSHLVEELVRRGERVRVVDSLITGKRQNLAHVPSVEFIEGDLADLAVAPAAVTGHRLRPPPGRDPIGAAVRRGSHHIQPRQH